MQETPIYFKHHLKDIPNYPLPKGFRFRFFQDEQDAYIWAKIVTKTKEFPSEQEAMNRFEREFAPYLTDVKQRMFFMETDQKPIGTGTAWYGNLNGEVIGRLHWIEIIPEYQGKKLGRPLISKAMQLLGRYHSTAYLKTQPSSKAAIHLYGKLGWVQV